MSTLPDYPKATTTGRGRPPAGGGDKNKLLRRQIKGRPVYLVATLSLSLLCNYAARSCGVPFIGSMYFSKLYVHAVMLIVMSMTKY